MRIRIVAVLLPVLLVSCASAPVANTPSAAPAGAVAATAVTRPKPAADADMPPLPLDAGSEDMLTKALAACDSLRRMHLANLANVHTIAHKRRVAVVGTTPRTTTDATLSEPVFRRAIPRFTQGDLDATGRDLDVAIDGEGFLAATLPDGRYGFTRVGRLALNCHGRIVTAAGHVVQPEITVPPDLLALIIASDGTVKGRTAGCPDVFTMFGRLTIHRFIDPEDLIEIDDGVFVMDDSGSPPMTDTPGTNGLGLLRQGFLERSNVDAEAELRELQAVECHRHQLLRLGRQIGYVAATARTGDRR